ncbi:MAG: universal stress protein [Candidatus Sericytochromatia bacterium]|nr:universal stress protein [Candidatus Sericytochromatia bacterium]
MRVVLGTDGSADAARAIAWVTACLPMAAIHLVAVAETPPTRLAPMPGLTLPEPISEVLLDAGLKQAQQALAHGQAQLTAAGRGPAATYVRLGNAARAILDLARGVQADLIVLGPHSHTCLTRLLHGSVSEEVLRAWPGAVLLVGGAVGVART